MIFTENFLAASSLNIFADGPSYKWLWSLYSGYLLVESEFLIGIFDCEIFGLSVLPAADFFKSLIFFRVGLPMAGVDGATLRADFLIIFPSGASILFF
jgi:hypothetical protein